MSRHDFRHVETWVFDLDNTLYRPELRLFDQIEVRMTDYVMQSLGVDGAEANRLRKLYWAEYGTTLAGLMKVHGLDPDPYLADVHDIDLSAIPQTLDLRAAIDALPGRKIVYTNGSRAHAVNVSAALGLSGAFDALYGIEDAGYVPKPAAAAFERIFARDAHDPRCSAMFEDDPRNLAFPHQSGMRTVLVGPGEPAPHIHHVTDDLTGFLGEII